MITISTKGLPLRPRADGKPREVDDEGFAVVVLDEARHDPFEVCNAAAKSLGYKISTAPDPKFEAIMKARREGERKQLARR